MNICWKRLMWLVTRKSNHVNLLAKCVDINHRAAPPLQVALNATQIKWMMGRLRCHVSVVCMKPCALRPTIMTSLVTLNTCNMYHLKNNGSLNTKCSTTISLSLSYYIVINLPTFLCCYPRAQTLMWLMSKEWFPLPRLNFYLRGHKWDPKFCWHVLRD